jgi:hypothetical protein
LSIERSWIRMRILVTVYGIKLGWHDHIFIMIAIQFA